MRIVFRDSDEMSKLAYNSDRFETILPPLS